MSPATVSTGATQPLRFSGVPGCRFAQTGVNVAGCPSPRARANSRCGATTALQRHGGSPPIGLSSTNVASTFAEKLRWIEILNRPRLIFTVSFTETEALAVIGIGS